MKNYLGKCRIRTIRQQKYSKNDIFGAYLRVLRAKYNCFNIDYISKLSLTNLRISRGLGTSSSLLNFQHNTFMMFLSQNSFSNFSSKVGSLGRFIFMNFLSLYPVQCWCIKLRKQYGHSPFPLWRKSVLNSVPLKIKSIFGFVIYLMAKFTNNRFTQRFLNRPTSSKTIFKKSTLKSFFSRPLSKWFGFTFISKQMTIRAIKVLIPQSIPSAVFSAIMSIRIFAVNSSIFLSKLLNVSKIRAIHFFLKIFKAIPQAFNSSPTITLKSVMIRIGATLFHSTPYIIKSSSRHSMFHNYSLANTGMVVNQFSTPLWITKSQLTDIWNKANKK